MQKKFKSLYVAEQRGKSISSKAALCTSHMDMAVNSVVERNLCSDVPWFLKVRRGKTQEQQIDQRSQKLVKKDEQTYLRGKKETRGVIVTPYNQSGLR